MSGGRVPYFTDGTSLMAMILNGIIDLCYEHMAEDQIPGAFDGVTGLVDASPIEPSEILDLIRKGYRVHT
jgi:hypothetical protein